MVNLRDNKDIAPMRQELWMLTKALDGLKSALGRGVAGIEKDIADLYHDLCANLSHLYLDLSPPGSFESKANLGKIIEEWRAVYRIADPLAKEDWSGDGAKMQPHLMWTKVGFIKARHHLNKLLVSFGFDYSVNSPRSEGTLFPPKTNSENPTYLLRLRNGVKIGYLEELQEMERRMASPPKPTSKTSEDKLVQAEVEFKTAKVECKDQATSCELGNDELRDANAEIEKLKSEIEKLKLEKVERLKKEQNWTDAEQVYREIIGLKCDGQGPEAADDAAILDLRYELAETQMNQKKYSNAEATARDVWEKRRRPPGEDSSATRSSRQQLCRALRGQGVEGKFKEATTMYREIWCYSADQNWKMENGHELGLVLAEQGRLKEAYLQHEKVWEERKKVLGAGEVDTVLSSQECLLILERQEKPDPIITENEDPDIIIRRKEEILRRIWEARRGPAEGFVDIPASGHRLGSLLFDQRHFDDAARILNGVWEARRSRKSALSDDSDDGLFDVLLTGDLLAQAYESCGKLEEARIVYKWICDTREEKLPPEDSRLLGARQRLGHILFEKRLFNDSAAECKKVWEVEVRLSLRPAPDTVLNAGLDLALSLEELGNIEEAYRVIERVCRCKSRQLPPEQSLDTHSFGTALRRIQQKRQEIGPRPASRLNTANPPNQLSTPQRRHGHREQKPKKKNGFF